MTQTHTPYGLGGKPDRNRPAWRLRREAEVGELRQQRLLGAPAADVCGSSHVTVMAGLVPAIHAEQCQTMLGGWVYIVTNRPNGTLYAGVTSNLSRRVHEHQEGLNNGFSKRYGLKRLVYYERYETITDAIQRENNMKRWPCAWKARLILDLNPDWDDLYETLA